MREQNRSLDPRDRVADTMRLCSRDWEESCSIGRPVLTKMKLGEIGLSKILKDIYESADTVEQVCQTSQEAVSLTQTALPLNHGLGCARRTRHLARRASCRGPTRCIASARSSAPVSRWSTRSAISRSVAPVAMLVFQLMSRGREHHPDQQQRLRTNAAKSSWVT